MWLINYFWCRDGYKEEPINDVDEINLMYQMLKVPGRESQNKKSVKGEQCFGLTLK